MSAPRIHKAGAVIRRSTPSGYNIYLIHRPRYDDWSLPKGHIDTGETPTQAALREVREETGFVCGIVAALPDYIYRLPSGQAVRVYLFVAEVQRDTGHSDTEADRGDWLSYDAAIDRLTYPALQQYLRDQRRGITA